MHLVPKRLLESSTSSAQCFAAATTPPVANETVLDASAKAWRFLLFNSAFTRLANTSWAVEAAISCEATVSCSNFACPCTTLSAASLYAN